MSNQMWTSVENPASGRMESVGLQPEKSLELLTSLGWFQHAKESDHLDFLARCQERHRKELAATRRVLKDSR